MKMKNTAVTAALLTAIAVPAYADNHFDFDLDNARAQSDSIQLNGFVESRNQRFLNSRNDDLTDHLSTRLRLYLEAKHELNDLTFFISGYGEVDNAKAKYRDLRRGELLEAYVTYDGGDVRLTAGRQRIAWGTADGRSTIDQLNITDFQDPIGNARTPSKRTSWAIRGQKTFDWGVVEAVVLPVGRDLRLPEAGSPWETSSLAALREGKRLALFDLRIDESDSAEGGLKVTKYAKGYDISAAYYNGTTSFPVLIRNVPGLMQLAQEDIEVFNLSGALAPKGIGTLRGEVAYTPNVPLGLGLDGDLKQAIVGWDRTFGQNLYVNVQLFGDWIENADNTYGATFAVSNVFLDDSLNVGVRGQVASRSQRTVEAYADFQFNDALTLSASIMKFDGDAGTVNADFDDNDFAELTARFSF